MGFNPQVPDPNRSRDQRQQADPRASRHSAYANRKNLPKYTPGGGLLRDGDNTYKDRGGCLSAFLAFVAFGNILTFFVQAGAMRSSRSAEAIIPIAGLIVLGILICVAGLWNWKRWGFIGLVSVFGLQVVLGLCTANLPAIVGGVLYLVILIALMNDKMDMLEA